MIRKLRTEVQYELEIPVIISRRKKPKNERFWLNHVINNASGDRETIFVLDGVGMTEVGDGAVKDQVIRYWKMGEMDAVDAILASSPSIDKSPQSFQQPFGDEGW